MVLKLSDGWKLNQLNDIIPVDVGVVLPKKKKTGKIRNFIILENKKKIKNSENVGVGSGGRISGDQNSHFSGGQKPKKHYFWLSIS